MIGSRYRELVRLGVAAAALDVASCPAKGGSSSASSTSTETTNIDKRLVVDGSSVGVSSDSSTVNVTATSLDGGAVNAAIDLAKVSSESGNKNVAEVLGFVRDTFGDVLKVAGENLKGTQGAFQQATEAVKGAFIAQADISTGQRAMVAGGLILAGIVAIKALGKGS